MTDTLVFGTSFDHITPALELEQSATPSSCESANSSSWTMETMETPQSQQSLEFAPSPSVLQNLPAATPGMDTTLPCFASLLSSMADNSYPTPPSSTASPLTDPAASTLPPQDTDNMGWIDFGDFNGLNAAAAFDAHPLVVAAAAAAAAPAPHHSPVTQLPSEQDLLSRLGHLFAPLHNQQSPSATSASSPTSSSPSMFMPSDTRAVKTEYKHHEYKPHPFKHEYPTPQSNATPAGVGHVATPATSNGSVSSPETAGNTATTSNSSMGLSLPTDLSMLFPVANMNNNNTTTSPVFPTDDDKWQAVLSRDPTADSAFVYCVTSTRIYCRPTCASRRPLRANTVYANSPAEAEALGYRACRRCLPHCLASASEMRQILAVEQAKVVIHDCVRDGRPAPSLSVLAQHVGMSKFHLQRTFKRLVGHSPDAHAKALAKAWRGVGRG